MMRLAILALCVYLSGAVPAYAHHSLSGYVKKDAVFLTGTVKAFRWANPHVLLTVEVAMDGAPPEEWTLETVGVGQLTEAKFRKDMIAAGDSVTVFYFPRRDGRVGGFFYALVLADGNTFTLQPPRARGGLSFTY